MFAEGGPGAHRMCGLILRDTAGDALWAQGPLPGSLSCSFFLHFASLAVRPTAIYFCILKESPPEVCLLPPPYANTRLKYLLLWVIVSFAFKCHPHRLCRST